jgi:hypothetical protein
MSGRNLTFGVVLFDVPDYITAEGARGTIERALRLAVDPGVVGKIHVHGLPPVTTPVQPGSEDEG